MKTSRRQKKPQEVEHPSRIKEISEEDYERMNRHSNIYAYPVKRAKPEPKPLGKVKYKPPKTTRAQELKEKSTRKLFLERKQKEQEEQLSIELRQQKIERERKRLQPTLKMVKTSMTNIHSLINRDRLKSTEKSYNEWLFLKQQEHEMRQTMLAKLTGDFTTFSIEKQINISKQIEREQREKEEQEEENKMDEEKEEEAKKTEEPEKQ